jgi:hypothetical protein
MKVLDFIKTYNPDTETEMHDGALFLCVDVYHNGYMKQYSIDTLDAYDISEHEIKLYNNRASEKPEINIIVKDSNKNKINDVFDSVQSKCRERKADYTDILYNIKWIEKGLSELNIPKKLWTGLKFYCCPAAEKLPNAYKWQAFSTNFVLERKKTTWNITKIERAELRENKRTLISHIPHNCDITDCLINNMRHI